MQFSTIMVVFFAMTSTAMVVPLAENNNKANTKTCSTKVPDESTKVPDESDYGSCIPTMDFQLGRGNRKATEGTFLPTDAKVAQGQQDALNPNIITNRICDQLTNVCGASEAAKKRCLDAKAKVAAADSKDKSMADLFNSALGFETKG